MASSPAPLTRQESAVEEALTPIRRFHQAGDIVAARMQIENLLQNPSCNLPAVQALYGTILLQDNKKERGKRLVRKAAGTEPLTSAWASDLGFGLLLAGDVSRAIDILRRAVAMPPPGAATFNRLGTAFFNNGDMKDAEAAFGEALLHDPNQAKFHFNLGSVAIKLGKLEEALGHYQQALAIQPDFPQAAAGRESVLLALEKPEELIVEIEERLKRFPESEEFRHQLVHLLSIAGRFQEAHTVLRQAAERHPEDIHLKLHLASFLIGRSRYGAARKILQEAEKLDPRNIQVITHLARVSSEMNNPAAARGYIENLFQLQPDTPGSLLVRAFVCANDDNFSQAEEDLRKILTIVPHSGEALGRLGHLFMQTGRLDEAVECFDRAAAINPGALAALIEARSFPENPETVARMVRFADNAFIAGEPRSAMAFAVAKVFEKQQEFDQAFSYAVKANTLVRKTISYDPRRSSRKVQQLKKYFTPKLFKQFRNAGSPVNRPVFVVGMPRSGTTLTEQMLCSHPEVYGAGELGFIPALTHLMPQVLNTRKQYPTCLPMLPQWMLKHAASYYLKKLAALDNKAIRTVDKLPHNFMHLGLIAMIFPNARIIHVNRDIRDIAISNFFTNFKQKHGGMGFAFDLADIGHMINDYREIMAHWRQVLPVEIFELQYEELVVNPQETSQRLFKFVGIDWDEQVLEFHHTKRAVKTASVWQVRQPLYTTSKERWRRYENHLGPFFDICTP